MKKICKYCRSEIDENSKFCPNCGKIVIDIAICPKCGEKVHLGDKFCPNCGTSLQVDETIESEKKGIQSKGLNLKERFKFIKNVKHKKQILIVCLVIVCLVCISTCTRNTSQTITSLESNTSSEVDKKAYTPDNEMFEDYNTDMSYWDAYDKFKNKDSFSDDTENFIDYTDIILDDIEGHYSAYFDNEDGCKINCVGIAFYNDYANYETLSRLISYFSNLYGNCEEHTDGTYKYLVWEDENGQYFSITCHGINAKYLYYYPNIEEYETFEAYAYVSSSSNSSTNSSSKTSTTTSEDSDWKVTVTSVNNSKTGTTNYDKLNGNQPVYFHFKVSGGNSGESKKIKATVTFPDGQKTEKDCGSFKTEGDGYFAFDDAVYTTGGIEGDLSISFKVGNSTSEAGSGKVHLYYDSTDMSKGYYTYGYYTTKYEMNVRVTQNYNGVDLATCDVEKTIPAGTKINIVNLFTGKDTNSLWGQIENKNGNGMGAAEIICIYDSNGSYLSRD